MSPDQFEAWRKEPMEPWEEYVERIQRRQQLLHAIKVWGVAVLVCAGVWAAAWLVLG